MSKKLNQASFFEVEDKKIIKEVEKKVNAKVLIPKEYIPIHLDSLGKLDAPKILHFRNYIFDDILELAKINDEDKIIEPLLETLNGMVYEDFNCKDLHPKELEQILCTIHLAFWGKELSNIPYFIDDTLEGEEILNKDNIGYANVDLSKLKTNPLMEEFKEPFTFKIGDNKVSFKLPKFRNQFIADAYIEAKFFDEERKYSDLREALSHNYRTKNEEDKLPIDKDELKKYEEYMEKRNTVYLKVHQASLIHAVNGKELTLEEKLKEKIDLRFWSVYNKKHVEWAKFGIDPVTEIFDTKEKKLISRGLQFRFVDFLPTIQSENSFEYDVIFDDTE